MPAALQPCVNDFETHGTKNKVAKVAKIKPPMTARPRGAFCSPPSPRPMAMGTMPMIMARAVMMTGRMRTKPLQERRPKAILAFGQLFARKKRPSRCCWQLATPMHMMRR